MITLDFETAAIVDNPLLNPPKPCGLAILDDSGSYYVEGMNEMAEAWKRAVESPHDLLFHNAPFDTRVAEEWLDGMQIPWHRIHDTMYSIFLTNPYAKTLSLKPSADFYLNLPPEEQDELHTWICANIPEATPKTAGAFISFAPSKLVAKYAVGDVVRTLGLHNALHPRVPEGAYDRERQLMPIMVEGTRHGIRVDRPQLEADAEMYDKVYDQCQDSIFATLDCDPFNIGSSHQLAAALDRADAVDGWEYTDKGNKRTAKDCLMMHIKDPELLHLLAYASSLKTCLGTFIKPWHEFSLEDGRVHPNWNQVRDTDYKSKGTKTGRLSSSSPNFQNVPNEFEQEIPPGYPPLPLMRKYCLPEEGHVWVKRDFSSQEIRWLAHFEDGSLMAQYQANPRLDPHKTAEDMIAEITGTRYERKHIKITAFSSIYGAGIPRLAGQMKTNVSHAYDVREGYYTAFPGVRTLQRATSKRGRSGEGVTTWGGRHYVTEPHPKFDFSYKLLNYLIQGSSADQTKQCIIDWYTIKPESNVFLATVHDEINISVPIGAVDRGMADLEAAMDQKMCDVPMRSEGFVGENWFDIRKIT